MDSQLQGLLLTLVIDILLAICIVIAFSLFRKYNSRNVEDEREPLLPPTMLGDTSDPTDPLRPLPPRLSSLERDSKMRDDLLRMNRGTDWADNMRQYLVENKIRKLGQDMRPKDLGNIFQWIKCLYTINDEDTKTICQTDGFLYLLFLKYLSIFFFIIMLINIFLLLPLFWIRRKDTHNTQLGQLTMSNILDSKHRLWTVYFITIIFAFMAFTMLYMFKRKVRRLSLEDAGNAFGDIGISNHSIRVKNIPTVLSCKDGDFMLYQTFKSICARNEVLGTHIIMDFNEEEYCLEERAETITKIKETNVYNNAHEERLIHRRGFWCCKKTADSEEHYKFKLNTLNDKLQAIKESHIMLNTGTAFVMFITPEVADRILKNFGQLQKDNNHLNYARALKFKSWEAKKAPPPSDIIWRNIGATTMQRFIRRFLLNFSLFFITIVLITPIAVLDKLNPLAYTLQKSLDEGNIFKIFIQNYFTPLIMLLFNGVLIPFLVYKLSNHEFYEQKSQLDKSCTTKNLIFMLLDTILLPLCGFTTIYTFLMFIGDSDLRTLENLFAVRIFETNDFFLRYMIQAAFVFNGFQLLALPVHLINKLKGWFNNAITSEKPQFNTWFFNLGYMCSFCITIFSLAFIFSVSVPLISVAAFLFFFFKYTVDKYNLIFVYPFEYESKGIVINLMIKYILIGVFLFILMMVCVFYTLPYQEFKIAAIVLFFFGTLLLYMAYRYLISSKRSAFMGRVIRFMGQDDSFDEYSRPSEENYNNEQWLQQLKTAYDHPIEKKGIIPLPPEEEKPRYTIGHRYRDRNKKSFGKKGKEMERATVPVLGARRQKTSSDEEEVSKRRDTISSSESHPNAKSENKHVFLLSDESMSLGSLEEEKAPTLSDEEDSENEMEKGAPDRILLDVMDNEGEGDNIQDNIESDEDSQEGSPVDSQEGGEIRSAQHQGEEVKERDDYGDDHYDQDEDDDEHDSQTIPHNVD